MNVNMFMREREGESKGEAVEHWLLLKTLFFLSRRPSLPLGNIYHIISPPSAQSHSILNFPFLFSSDICPFTSFFLRNVSPEPRSHGTGRQANREGRLSEKWRFSSLAAHPLRWNNVKPQKRGFNEAKPDSGGKKGAGMLLHMNQARTWMRAKIKPLSIRVNQCAESWSQNSPPHIS